ncbi:MAG TPA: two-component regulator propeller domain-containing protein [Blastocatellia bacterium]|nr:two-component regulator propeller domain-containing protein [Blastocatellia bacterium]
MFCLLIVLALLAADPLMIRAANGSPASLHQWGAVTLFHGLPSDHVRAIAQDSEGVMWFATDGGLARYDGRRVQKVSDDALPSERIRALSFDFDGRLWIGTDAGAAVLADNQFKRVPQTESQAITAIAAPGGGRAFMTGERGEIFDCRLLGNGSFAVSAITPADTPLLSTDANGHAPLPITSMAAFDNALVVGTRGRGLLRVQTDRNDAPIVQEILSRPRAFYVEAVAFDASHQLWFGSQTTAADSGLYASGDLRHPEKVSAGLGTVTALCFDRRGDLWAGTDGQGAARFHDGRRLERFTFASTAGGLRSDHVYAVFVDRESVVWFGTDRGICRYDPHGPRVEQISEDRESNFARTLFRASSGEMWCGTNRGLFAHTAEGWEANPSLAGTAIHAINEDAGGRLLVGTAAGLFIESSSQDHSPPSRSPLTTAFARFDESSDSVRAIQRFRGALYVASFGRGLERLEANSRARVWPADTGDASLRQVVSLYAEGDRRLWIGTATAGVFVFDGASTRAADGLDGLRGAAVWAIDGAPDRVLWVATARGLFALRDGKLTALINDTDARGVVATAPNLAWCATADKGLYRVLLDDAAGVITGRRDVEQGLPSEQVFAILAPRDQPTVWVGTNRGLARFEPNTVAPLVFPARVLGKRLFSNEEVRAGLSLEYPQNSLAIDMAASSSRSFPEQFQYAFAVVDDAGRALRQKLSRDSQLLLEGLRAGRYRVEARAFTNDLMASEPFVIEFTVTRAPFPWASAALAFLLLLALVAVGWGYRQNRRMRRTNTALESTNLQLAETRLQIANETEAERRRIARDLHDQTLADLRRLLMMSDQLPANGHATAEPLRFRQEIENLSGEIRRICEDLSPSALANVGLAAALEWALTNGVAQLPDEQKFAYEFQCEDGLDDKHHLKSAVQIQIFRIVQEAVNNVCRHAAATRVSLRASIDAGGALLIELADDGHGFDASQTNGRRGRGLANIGSRASLIDAEVSWTPRAEGGTCFTLRKAIPRAAVS